jgi:hypothetical protein
VLAPPSETTTLYHYGNLLGLGTPAWDNFAEIQAAIRIVSASNPEEAKGLIDCRGVRFIVIPSWDSYLDEYAQDGMGQLEGTSIARLHAWNITRWLRPMAFHLPAGAGLDGQSVTIFEVVDDQDEALALSRLAKYFVEMNRMDLAVGAARGLRRYPTDLDSWIARAEVATATGNEEAAGGALKLIIPRIKSGAYPRLPLDRRVGLAVLLARNRQTDLARDQTRACIDQLNETELRSLSTCSLYRLLVLIKGFGLRIDQPPMLVLSRNLLPQDLRGRL